MAFIPWFGDLEFEFEADPWRLWRLCIRSSSIEVSSLTSESL